MGIGIRVPVLAISGATDPSETSAIADRIVRDVRGARFVTAGDLVADAGLQAVDIDPVPRLSCGGVGCIRGCNFGVGRGFWEGAACIDR
jgi:hypothetical protein